MIRPAGGLAALVAAGTIVAAGLAHARPVPESTFRTEVSGGNVIPSVENAEFALAPDGRSIGVTDAEAAYPEGTDSGARSRAPNYEFLPTAGVSAAARDRPAPHDRCGHGAPEVSGA
ncbi:hypothetical protein, partial [Nocardia cyriacigeorgica]|uniref:hypothetical protein n=1 Tax=Nocardia cyriacigeorgica TaxID=135487 RepID=UPI002455AA51